MERKIFDEPHPRMKNRFEYLKYLKDFDTLFQKRKVLGRGGFGEVMLCKTKCDIYPERLVAVKKIIYDSYIVKSLKREIAAMKRVTESNVECIAKYYDSFYSVEDDKTDNSGIVFYIVMEYIKGKNMNDFVYENKLEKIPTQRERTEFLIDFSYKMLKTLAEIHHLNWCHRDIKLDNILYYYEGDKIKFKLVDFGLSCYVKPNFKDYSCDLTDTSGTVYYDSPEKIELYLIRLRSSTRRQNSNYKEKLNTEKGLQRVKKIDVWAMALTIYCVIENNSDPWGTRRIKKDNDTEKEMYQKILFERILDDKYEIPYTYPEKTEKEKALKAVVYNGLYKDYKKRPSAYALYKYLEQYN